MPSEDRRRGRSDGQIAIRRYEGPHRARWISGSLTLIILLLLLGGTLVLTGINKRATVQTSAVFTFGIVLLILGFLGLAGLARSGVRRFYHRKILGRLQSIMTRLHPDKQSLTARAFDVVLFPDEGDLSSKLREITSMLVAFAGHRQRAEPQPFFPAILHLFLSTMLFEATETGSAKSETLSAVAECYASLIDHYLDVDRIQLAAEYCVIWLADWEGSRQYVAHEVMRLIVPSILMRLKRPFDPDPAVLRRSVSFILNLMEAVVRHSQLVMTNVNDRGAFQKEMLELSYNVLIELVETCPSESTEAVQLFVERMFPNRQDCWARWEETDANPLGKIGYKWVDAVKRCVERLSDAQKSQFCQRLRTHVDSALPGVATPRLIAFHAYLDEHIPRTRIKRPPV